MYSRSYGTLALCAKRRTGTSAADNVQQVNLIFLFMINSAIIGAKDCRGNNI